MTGSFFFAGVFCRDCEMVIETNRLPNESSAVEGGFYWYPSGAGMGDSKGELGNKGTCYTNLLIN